MPTSMQACAHTCRPALARSYWTRQEAVRRLGGRAQLQRQRRRRNLLAGRRQRPHRCRCRRQVDGAGGGLPGASCFRTPAVAVARARQRGASHFRSVRGSARRRRRLKQLAALRLGLGRWRHKGQKPLPCRRRRWHPTPFRPRADPRPSSLPAAGMGCGVARVGSGSSGCLPARLLVLMRLLVPGQRRTRAGKPCPSSTVPQRAVGRQHQRQVDPSKAGLAADGRAASGTAIGCANLRGAAPTSNALRMRHRRSGHGGCDGHRRWLLGPMAWGSHEAARGRPSGCVCDSGAAAEGVMLGHDALRTLLLRKGAAAAGQGCRGDAQGLAAARRGRTRRSPSHGWWSPRDDCGCVSFGRPGSGAAGLSLRFLLLLLLQRLRRC